MSSGCFSNDYGEATFPAFDLETHYAEDCVDIDPENIHTENRIAIMDIGCNMNLMMATTTPIQECQGFLWTGSFDTYREGKPQPGDVYFLVCEGDENGDGITWIDANEACVNSGLYDGVMSFKSTSEVQALESYLYIGADLDTYPLHIGYSTYEDLSIQEDGSLGIQ